MYTLYKFHFLNGINKSRINQLFDDILIIWPAPVCVCVYIYIYMCVCTAYLPLSYDSFLAFLLQPQLSKKKKKKIFGGFFSQTYHICGALKFQNDLPTKIAYKFL